MENMTEIQYAWMIYLIGAIGCCLATWLLFRRFGRAWTHFFVITVMVILLPPFANTLEDGQFIVAPAIFGLVLGFMESGFEAIKPIVKLLLGMWVGALSLSLIYQLLTRKRYQQKLAHTEVEEVERLAANQRRRRQSLDEVEVTKPEKAESEDFMDEPIRAVR